MSRPHFATAGALAILVATSSVHAQDAADTEAAPSSPSSAAVVPTAAQPAPPPPASADPDKLFTDAMNLISEEKYDAAIPLLEETQRIDPGIGTQFNLAICYAKTGRLALAWRNFRQVETLAGAAGKKERAQAARAKLAELRPRLPNVAVRLESGQLTRGADSVTVRVDGEIVEAADLGFVPLDPGEHKVEVSAPGRQPFEKAVVVTAAEGERQEILVQTLAPLVTKTEIRTITEETSNTKRTLGYVFGSIGLAGVAAATVTGILILSDKSTADQRCKPGCVTATGDVDSTGADAVQRGKTLLPINVISWVVAGAGLGAGAFFLITSRKQAPPVARTTVLPSFDARGGASAVLSTTF